MIPHEQFDAICGQVQGLNLFVSGHGAAAFTALADSFFRPTLVRYAFMGAEILGTFFPYMAADDVGALYKGFAAFDWIQSSGLLFPRSDVMGVWHDGAEDQLFLKQLDLAIPAVAYAAPNTETFPGLKLAAAVEIVEDESITLARGGGLPVRFASCVPTFQIGSQNLTRATLQSLLQSL